MSLINCECSEFTVEPIVNQTAASEFFYNGFSIAEEIQILKIAAECLDKVLYSAMWRHSLLNRVTWRFIRAGFENLCIGSGGAGLACPSLVLALLRDDDNYEDALKRSPRLRRLLRSHSAHVILKIRDLERIGLNVLFPVHDLLPGVVCRPKMGIEDANKDKPTFLPHNPRLFPELLTFR